MIYIKYTDYLANNDLIKDLEDYSILMSLEEFESGGKLLKHFPITVTKNGEEPIEIDFEEFNEEE